MGHHDGPPTFDLTHGLAFGLALLLLLLAKHLMARKKENVD
jgi:hypothetical protein